jgi:hypothetical protein
MNYICLSYELFLYLEKKLFGNLDKLKIKLKGMVLGDERKATAYAVEELAEVSSSKGKAYTYDDAYDA